MPSQSISQTEPELRALYGEPSKLPAKAISNRLEAHSRRFIELSPLVIIASTDGRANVDLSPRGDAPGFVTVEDDQTLVIPDRKGNNKIDTLRNLCAADMVGLMFVIPGINEVLRIRGRATISVDLEQCQRHAVGGVAPKSLMIVRIHTIFPHCGKAFIRSGLWQDDARRDRKRDGVPSLAQIAMAMADMDEEAVDAVDAKIQQDYKSSLY